MNHQEKKEPWNFRTPAIVSCCTVSGLFAFFAVVGAVGPYPPPITGFAAAAIYIASLALSFGYCVMLSNTHKF